MTEAMIKKRDEAAKNYVLARLRNPNDDPYFTKGDVGCGFEKGADWMEAEMRAQLEELRSAIRKILIHSIANEPEKIWKIGEQALIESGGL